MGSTPAGARGLVVIAAAVLGIGLGAAAIGSASSRPTLRPRAAAVPQQTSGPSASIADSGDVSIGVPVKLDASGSQGDSLLYSWDFGDGSGPATGATVQHSYALVDDYKLRVTVHDRLGNADTATRTIRVVPAVGTLTGRPQLGQIAPASSFTALLSLDAAGPAQVSATVGGRYLSSQRWDFQGGNGPALFEIPDIRVVNEENQDIIDQLLSQPGASIPLTNNVSVTLTYPVSAGGTESAAYTMSMMRPAADAGSSPGSGGSTSAAGYLQATPTPTAAPPATATPPTATAVPAATTAPTPTSEAAPAQPTVWSITYPTYLPVVGRPANEDDVGDYYLQGDKDFHNVDTTTVRRWAIKIARNGGIFPDDPQRAADNIYRYVNGLLGIGDPGELQTDVIILGRVADGVLVPGARKGEYICIAHAYFLSSLTRTLGLPTREVTIGFGRGVSQDDSGAWKLNFYQEGANEVWYAGAWHHYDTWIGTRNRADYLDTNLTEIAWYAYSAESTPFTDVNGKPVGLSGHDFALGKYVGSPGSPDQWRFLEQQTRPGIRIADPGPEAYASVERATTAPRPAETVVAGILNPDTGTSQ